MLIDEDDENTLAHYGIKRKSGRYPWGSGPDSNTTVQRSQSFLNIVDSMKAQGMTESEIAKSFSTDDYPFTSTDLRATRSVAKQEIQRDLINRAEKLKAKDWSNVAIGKELGIGESRVRSLLAPGQRDKAGIHTATADMLRAEMEKGGYIQIGKGVHNMLGMAPTRLSTAVSILKGEGYVVRTVQVDQLGTNNKTLVKVLAPPGTTYRDVASNQSAIRFIGMKSDDGGRSFYGMLPPKTLSLDRVGIVYKEDGGSLNDGVMYVRPGVEDVSLGGSRYAQVRVNVDGTHYLKGMAIYRDDLPRGVDVLFNTNKSDTGNKLDALKEQTGDPDNPFGAVINRQIGKTDPVTGKVTELTSTMNVLSEEGDWGKWSKTISSQVLSKQTPALIKQQLDLTQANRKEELNEILSLTNPSVRRKLLDSYADSVDSAAVHLKAANLPRQAWQVILPVNTLKENEVFAPNFRDGERVALIRYPHGGKFEIPELVVNNRNPLASAVIGRQAKDAIGINARVAERLSGADFDGDTVIVIPNNKGSVKSEPPLAKLQNFDPQSEYKPYDGMKTIDGGVYNAKTRKTEFAPGQKPMTKNKGTEMGYISNLITDMTIRGANNNEIAQAVKHSMVVIDAEKHKLDYKRSAIENGIPALVKKYQPREDGRNIGGSSTLISRAEGRIDVRARKRTYTVDPETGKKVYRETGESWVDAKTGKTMYRTQQSKKLAETDDANTLSSGTKQEKLYAQHSNALKALANQARLASVNTPNIPYSPSAQRAYKAEVQSLNAKLNLALTNAPRERQAQIAANHLIAMKRQANPNMDETQLKKIKSQALTEQRNRFDAKKAKVDITPREWEAIQAGGITANKLKDILDNADEVQVKKLAMPKTQLSMTSSKIAKANAMANAGYTQAEIADALGVSLTTLKVGIK